MSIGVVLQDEKEHEHARLVMMCYPEMNLSGFVREMRDEFPLMRVNRILTIWNAYVPAFGRPAYLDIETGKHKITTLNPPLPPKSKREERMR